eukprot:CAMPEP_0197187674 /NCGR_PEP_ID=MMETSP1423-20130617/16319_1 /TAXON_ID=476441 /ORGANISM="Pseudo-nitzschia heimii, Strain UNC1101" /LENGTH=647 /DNA_ID=CAMNT_0042639315 /DNA_START=33 /DNA_END=1973 /DNA_ORIENTATION=+
MIRARAINATTANNGTSTTTKLSSSSNKRRDGKGGGGSTYILVIFGFMVVIMVVYCVAGLYAVLQIDSRKIKVPSASSTSQAVVSTARMSDQASYKLLGEIRSKFNERYTVKNAEGRSILDGHQLLKKGLHSFGSIEVTARRILEASKAKRPFVMAFSGYSITVGRGNFYNQSFPFVAGGLLEEPMKQMFDIPLVVRNAAIGGIPSFPYGFCLDHFLGTDPDVISWDYSMNEGGTDSSVLEAFVRQATAQLPKRPMVIMVDTNRKRMTTLDEYTRRGWLGDAIAIGKKDILNEKEIFGEKADPTPEVNLPPGFQEWNEFGAPKNCPGRGSWHPKKQEHAMMGWMIAMHFIEAMEKAIEMRQQETTSDSNNRRQQEVSSTMPQYGKPFSSNPHKNDPEVTELLFGHHSNNGEDYIMKQLSCRTSFLPATDHSRTLPSVVVSGLAEGDLDIMVDRTDKHYQEGWVLDVSKVERDTKRKVERCGGLGYVDMKIALYGIPESGKLRLWLPFEGPSHDHHDHDGADTNARHWFDDFILCEANDKRDEKACKLDQDLELIVGGVDVAADNVHPLKGAAEYLKRPTCVNVGVPKDAVVTPLGDLRTPEGKLLSQDEKAKFGTYGDEALGMVVDITSKPIVTRTNGACCLSHIIW